MRTYLLDIDLEIDSPEERLEESSQSRIGWTCFIREGDTFSRCAILFNFLLITTLFGIFIWFFAVHLK